MEWPWTVLARKRSASSTDAEAGKSSNQVLSIMFVDIVGFSIASEQMPPDKVYVKLNELLSPLSEIVYKHGGIIDKTIGDGFLCFFSTEKEIIGSHAERAIACACELQRYALKRTLKAVSMDTPVFPLRIGINTANVCVGDIGGLRRTEFTIFGHGVNVAQRLEQACETFRIMVAKETLRRWANLDGGAVSVHKRRIQMKHKEEVFEAFEINPFEAEPKKLSLAMRKYREQSGFVRSEERFPFKTSLPLSIHSDRIEGSMLNFSRSGLAVEADAYFGKGTVVNIIPQIIDPELEIICRRHKVPYSVKAEVRWGCANNDAYVHGLKIIDLTDKQKNALFLAMQEYMEKRTPLLIQEVEPQRTA